MTIAHKRTLAILLSILVGAQGAAHALPAFIANLWTQNNKPKTSFAAAALGIAVACYIKNKLSEPTTVHKQVARYYASKETQHLITEPVEWPVKLVYDDNPFSWLLAWAGGYVGKYITRYAGNMANSEDPAAVKAKIDHYQKFYKDVLDMNEFVVPAQGFKTFNQWFIRELKNIDQDRPFSDVNPLSIASPADGKLLIIPNLAQDTQVMIKEKLFDLKKFLGDATLAKTFEGGVMMIFRLSPYDYHRYHYPFDCCVGTEHYINGAYHSVNPRAFNVGCKPLTENLRSYELLTPAGRVDSYFLHKAVMVQVGATAVASIYNHFMDYESDRPKNSEKVYGKGQETGYFQFGGSTIVLLFPPNTIIPDGKIVANSLRGYETAVKVRETVATWMTPQETLQISKK